jgi:hypothetical protein
VPATIKNVQRVLNFSVIHYGFADYKNLAYKYFTYRKHGQSGYYLHRIIVEDHDRHIKKILDADVEYLSLVNDKHNMAYTVYRVNKLLIPDELWIQNERMPLKKTFAENFLEISKYREEVEKPNITFICPASKNISRLRFMYKQILKYIDLTDNEFYFVTQHSAPDVIVYLKYKRIPHVVCESDNELDRYGLGVKTAKGDYVVLLDDTHAFSHDWFDSLLVNFEADTAVSPRSIGNFDGCDDDQDKFNLKMDFGDEFNKFDVQKENEFNNFSRMIKTDVIDDMTGSDTASTSVLPLLIKRSDCLKAVEDPATNNIKSMISTLKNLGVNHKINFNSIVYKFAKDKSFDVADNGIYIKNLHNQNNLAICNDYLKGSGGEIKFWQYLVNGCSNIVPVDVQTTKPAHNFEKEASAYIKNLYPNTTVILQNATFMNNINYPAFKIMLLQDNLRSMSDVFAHDVMLQYSNLVNANLLVTNSIITAASYPDFDCKILPIGINEKVFRPYNDKEKEFVRKKYNMEYKKIGIFVGSLTAVKGWDIMKNIIEKRKDIYWIIVSKHRFENYQNENVGFIKNIDHSVLVELLNCADFFILCSPVETQCLAACEACFCDIPIIMNDTGIFYEFTKEEKDKVGIIGENFEKAVDEIYDNIKNKKFSPREIMLKKKLTAVDFVNRWEKLFCNVQIEIDRKIFTNLD